MLIVNAQELARYEFDEVNVVYAAEFTAKPINVNPNNWLVQIAGGTDKTISVLYGIVELKKSGKTELTEEFIRVEGEGGFERFLLNSWSSHLENQIKFPVTGESLYEIDTSSLKEAGDQNIKVVSVDNKFSGDTQSFFWSAKKIVDTNIVKDFTPPIKSVSLYMRFKDGLRYLILLSAPESEEKDKQNADALTQTIGKEQVIKEGEACDITSSTELSMCFNHCFSISERWAATCDNNVCKCVRPLGEKETQPVAEVQKIYFIADDYGPASDIVLIVNLTKDLESEIGNNYETKLKSEVTNAEFKNKVSVFVYTNKALIIIGVESSENDKLLAEKVSSLLKNKYGVDTTTKTSLDIKSENLIDEIIQKPSIKEGSQCNPETPEGKLASDDVLKCLSYCSSIGINQATCNDGTCKCVTAGSTPKRSMKEGDSCNAQSSDDIVACSDYCISIGKNIVSCENGTCSCP